MMTGLQQDEAGVTADEASPSGNQQLGHGSNERVSLGFALSYAAMDLDTALVQGWR